MLLGKDIGPFHIEKELGSGAMGSVYQALLRETGQRVAFKIIGLAQLGNETAIARFEREGKILKQLKHPNITRLIATGHYKKTPFSPWNWSRANRSTRCSAAGQLFVGGSRLLGKQLCAALQHAHMKGIIHRDLKPSNVMVLPDGTVKLTDFGIAKDMDVTALTGANSTVGTAAYMSPEQCRGEKNIGPKSDLYSMGVMFYELLTGKKPFVADSPVDMFLMHVNAEPVRVGKLVLSIPTWLDTLVDQLMAKKPEHRPFDAAMVAKALEEVEEKAIKQQSAGLDAVTARRIDRPGSRRRGCRPRSRSRPARCIDAQKDPQETAGHGPICLVARGGAGRGALRRVRPDLLHDPPAVAGQALRVGQRGRGSE